ncbi:glycosyltransferase family 2 protein [Methylobacter sp. S3L5C]|uniref:glycosyltransferase n=1 Tax=Methylobacter sp. S3L5C TaxID=2839024 RepID=UPI001FAD46ED|nr:glycosyltransferase family 2 protein [Methylobacter sp. S3L5C]UOA10197.1 glycosyltransferase family 2 protein [Methylobacter sp. S3L5C]
MTNYIQKPTSADNKPETKQLPAYVIITPARNEAAFIELTLKSMILQTVLPIKWIIVSDGSTDGTDEIIEKYTTKYHWIELIKMPDRAERNFAGKVHCFNAGYKIAQNLEHEIIGNVDADISFGPDHFEFLLDKFRNNSQLGVAGTAFIEDSTIAYNYDIVNIEHVSGQCQLFRSDCFDEIGGYLPIKGGGIDWTAVTTARMRGWDTRTFTEKSFVHHRKMGTGTSTVLRSRFKFGKQDYYLGGHPVWELFRAIYQMKNKPYIVSGLFLYCGYLWGFINQLQRPISQELVDFRRSEQKHRLKKIFKSMLLNNFNRVFF